MTWLRFASVLFASTALLACGDADPPPGEQPPRWLDDVEADTPTLLSEVGVYRDLGSRAVHDDGFVYTPSHVLFSNGLDKERALFLPAGASIDTSSPQRWVFPVGTVLSKTFTHEGAPVETRLLFKREERWDYALYAWRADGTDAELLPGNWAEEVLSLAGGVTHTLPARLDCRTCHETSEESFGTPVLGLSTHQLGADAPTPLADAEATEVAGRTPAETAALGYFVGNCTSCHTGGDGTNASFSLFPDAAVDNLVDRETETETAEGIRLVPGDVATSVLFISVVDAAEPDYGGPFKVMPPLGLNTRDPAVEGILRDWIEEL